MTGMKQRMQEVRDLTHLLEKEFPKETEGFLDFLKDAESGANISRKNKELINVALSLAAQCEWCIAFHVKSAAQAGASRNEIVEAGFQAVIMHGGPAFMWMTRLLQAVDEFSTRDDKVLQA